MSDFTDLYKEYLILQYYNKPKAVAEIQVYSEEFENNFNFLNDFFTEFDLDQATGDRLDLIGKIVGISRIVEEGVQKFYFGYAGAGNELAYDEGRYRGDSDVLATPTQLDDGQYRIFIKAKVTKNTSSSKVVSDERTGLQQSISDLFNKKAYVVDNLDMTMTINIDDDVPTSDVDLIVNAGLLPNPQGVSFIINYIPVV